MRTMPGWAWYAVAAASVLLTGWALDKLLCWCELRGWISYRLTPRQQRSLGAAAFQIESLLQPSKRHVYEMKQQAEVYREADDEGGDPPADSKA